MWSDDHGRQPQALTEARALARAGADVPIAPVPVQPDQLAERVGERPAPPHPDLLQRRVHGDPVDLINQRPSFLPERTGERPA
jgi:hypothetical protein